MYPGSQIPPTGPRHVPVLVAETISLLAPGAGQTYVDATAGLGGHAAAIAPCLGPTGTIVLNDADAQNLPLAEQAVRRACPDPPRIITVHGNYAELPAWLMARGLAADMVLADLGFASHQVEEAGRGFSFARSGPLDMRYDRSRGPTAAMLVASLPERELARVIADFGEERHARRIARKLVEVRRRTPILTTDQLAAIVRSAVGKSARRGFDPATRTFQALRIAVNDELGSLAALLEQIIQAAEQLAGGRSSWLRPGARVAFIAFHSLEDRPIKRTMLALARRGLARRLTRKPVRPSEAERRDNPRARSARLRAICLGA